MPQDTRKDPRAKVLSLNVRYKSATVDEFIEHHSHDISKGGIFIKTPSPFPAGTLLKFEIRIREDQPLIAGVGRVVWKREPPQATAERPAGMGVKFIKLDGQSRELIDRIVAERKGDGPDFEETSDGNPPVSAHPPPPAAATTPIAPIADTVNGPGGGSFFPSGPPAEQPPPQERTVIKQADEILADALKGAGLGDASAAPQPIELPKVPSEGPGVRKQTLLGMPAAPGGLELPPEVVAAAKEYEAARSAPPEASPVASEQAAAFEPARPIEPAAPEPVAATPLAAEPAVAADVAPPRVETTASVRAVTERADDLPPRSEPAPSARARKPLATAAQAAPLEDKGGGAGGWLVVLLLVAVAGVGAYYLFVPRGDEGATPTPAASAPVSVAPPPVESVPPAATAPPVESVAPVGSEPTPAVSAPASVDPATPPAVSAAASAPPTAAPPATTAAPPATTAAPPATTAAPPKPVVPKPVVPKPVAPKPKPPADDNPYQ
jgi:uncharacterized protein (TIGR02266 family)